MIIKICENGSVNFFVNGSCYSICDKMKASKIIRYSPYFATLKIAVFCYTLYWLIISMLPGDWSIDSLHLYSLCIFGPFTGVMNVIDTAVNCWVVECIVVLADVRVWLVCWCGCWCWCEECSILSVFWWVLVSWIAVPFQWILYASAANKWSWCVLCPPLTPILRATISLYLVEGLSRSIRQGRAMLIADK